MQNNLSLWSNLERQLEIIFQCAPGQHEIRVIGRYYQVKLNQRPIEKIWTTQDDRTQVYSIGVPKTALEALGLIQNHFSDVYPPHNCFIVLNHVSDDFNVDAKSRRIGGKWHRQIGFNFTKTGDIVVLSVLAVGVDLLKISITDEKLQCLRQKIINLSIYKRSG